MLEGIGSMAAYAVIKRSSESLTQRFAGSKAVEADIGDFRERMSRIKTPEALLKDRKALEFVLSAYQLNSEIGKTGLLRKLMTEDPTDDKALANRLADPRFAKFAKAFSKWEPKPPGADAALMTSVINDYMTVRFEREVGKGNPGLQEALYFLRNASKATTVPQLMADRALMYVARVALNLPEKFQMQPYENQRNELARRLNMEDFQDPKKVERFAQRFLTNLQISGAGGGGGSSSPAVAILGGGGGVGGLTSLLGQTINLRV